mgnify:CR=1 FL=1
MAGRRTGLPPAAVPKYRTLLAAKRLLEAAGYGVQEAANGEEALRLQHDAPADLIITDILMPEKEGLETIRDLRRDYPEIKIIAMSGGARMGPEAYLQLAESLGAERCFTKPIPREELIATIHSLVGPSR